VYSTGDQSPKPDSRGVEPGQQAGTPLQPAIRRVMSATNCRPVSIQASRALRPFGVPLAFLDGLNVDMDRLMPFEQFAAKMKLKRLWQVTEANHQIEEEIAQKEALIAGCLPPDTQVFMKVFDDLTQKCTVLRVNAQQGTADLEGIITAKLGRGVVLSIETRFSKVAPFDDNNLRDAQGRIASKEAVALTICAQ
jgi:hypothetical protein